MFGSHILDIALGLVLVYLLLSLIMTAVQETLAAILSSRSRNLERALTELLQGDQRLVEAFYDHPLIYALHRGQRRLPAAAASSEAAAAPSTAVADGDAGHAPDSRAPARPSYIPRETFSAVMIDLSQGGELRGHVERALDGLRGVAGDDLPRLRRELEGWYDGAMDRAAGWYKRNTQVSLFFLGLFVSILLNVNSVTLAQHLAVQPQAREYANQLAERVAAAPLDNGDAIRRYADQLDEVRLPIGWNAASLGRIASTFPQQPEATQRQWSYWLAFAGALLSLIAGYLITALAIMLGAPFWFDILNRVMVIRSTVKPKEKSADEPSEDGGRSARRVEADINIAR